MIDLHALATADMSQAPAASDTKWQRAEIDYMLCEIQTAIEQGLAPGIKDWEADFISSIIDYFEEHVRLTSKQHDQLRRIYQTRIM